MLRITCLPVQWAHRLVENVRKVMYVKSANRNIFSYTRTVLLVTPI